MRVTYGNSYCTWGAPTGRCVINSKINENPNFSVEEVTKIVNGGDKALDERKKAYEKCCEKIKK